MPRLLKAALLAPLAFAGLLLALLSIFYYEAIVEGGEKAQGIVVLAALGNLLLMNVMVFLLGWPYYLFLKKRNAVTRRNIFWGGFGALFAVGLFISLYTHSTHSWQVVLQAGIYGLCGLFVAWLIWRWGLKPTG